LARKTFPSFFRFRLATFWQAERFVKTAFAPAGRSAPDFALSRSMAMGAARAAANGQGFAHRLRLLAIRADRGNASRHCGSAKLCVQAGSAFGLRVCWRSKAGDR
jgi:hypothetical protein